MFDFCFVEFVVLEFFFGLCEQLASLVFNQRATCRFYVNCFLLYTLKSSCYILVFPSGGFCLVQGLLSRVQCSIGFDNYLGSFAKHN